MSPKIELGKRVRDTVTGFSGILTASCEHFHGNLRLEISALTDGEIKEEWVDAARVVEVVEAEKE